jgi:hypothetical protein
MGLLDIVFCVCMCTIFQYYGDVLYYMGYSTGYFRRLIVGIHVWI